MKPNHRRIPLGTLGRLGSLGAAGMLAGLALAAEPPAMPAAPAPVEAKALPTPAKLPAAAPARKGAPDKATREKEAIAAREAETSRLLDTFAAAQRKGDIEAAAQAVARLQPLLPTDSVALSRRAAWVEQMRGNREAARRLLGQVIAKLPDDLNANMNLALVDAHDGRTREAITRLRKLKLVYPEAIELDALLAELEGRSLVVTRSAPGG